MAKHRLLSELFNVSSRADRIKSNPETRAKSVYFGITSIVFSILAVACAVGAVYLLSLLTGGNKDALILLLFTFAGIAACVGGMLTAFISAVIRMIAQLSVNKRAVGWIALALILAAIAAVVVAAVVVLK